MGVTRHELSLLRYMANRAPLGDTLTIGRHWLLAEPAEVDAIVGRPVAPARYCDDAIRALGATSVQTLDASDYEGANFVVDLNTPHEPTETFDLVADFGSLEHIFHVPNALATLRKLCRPGGRIAHVLPANNLAGHGFWQFSGGELFFELYSEANGFADTEIFYASGLDFDHWYRARRPKPGERFEFVSMEPIITLVVTRVVDPHRALGAVSQPFYSGAWSEGSGDDLREAIDVSGRQHAGIKRLLRANGALYRGVRNLRLAAQLAAGRGPYSLAHHFERVAVRSLIAR